MQRTYKFRLYPTRNQEEKLFWTLDKCRFTYNYLLEQKTEHGLKRSELQALLPKLKKERLELQGVHSKTLQYENYRLHSNIIALHQLKKSGRKVGKLRFKGKNWFKTFTYNQTGFKVITTNKRCQKLHLSKIGDISIRIHRAFEGKIKQITIKHYLSGKWFTSLSVEQKTEKETNPSDRKIGIDVGIKHFLTDSDGRQIENPRNYGKLLDRIRIEQRRLSRKRKGSINKERQKIKLARVHEKLVNKRDDFLHKVSRFYVDNYGLIAVEGLNITDMTKNHYFAQKILDASWGKLIQMLSYKAESADRIVVEVDPRGTSKEYKFGKLDRDYNASLNILMRGVSGQGLSLEPLEIEPLRELIQVPASFIVEGGSPQALAVG